MCLPYSGFLYTPNLTCHKHRSQCVIRWVHTYPSPTIGPSVILPQSRRPQMNTRPTGYRTLQVTITGLTVHSTSGQVRSDVRTVLWCVVPVRPSASYDHRVVCTTTVDTSSLFPLRFYRRVIYLGTKMLLGGRERWLFRSIKEWCFLFINLEVVVSRPFRLSETSSLRYLTVVRVHQLYLTYGVWL